MYLHPGLEATSDIAEPVTAIPDLTDTTCAPQTDSTGLCDAVSLSLGLGASAGSARSSGAVQESGLRDGVKMTDALSRETNFKDNDSGFSFIGCTDVNGVAPSCLDMLHSNERDSFVKMSDGPGLESHAGQVAPSQLKDLFPYKPSYYKKSTNSSRPEDACSSSVDPAPANSTGLWYCKYREFSHGSFWRPCPYTNPYTPLVDTDGSGIADMRAASQVECGRVESYRSGMQLFINAPVKTEAIWGDAIDTSCDMFPEMRAFASHRRVCQVCGDNASGCHYGAITCGSCKVFFKRAAEGKQNHLCASRNDCTIDKLRRKNCPSCRLRRCFLCGMSLRGRRQKASGQPSSEQEWGTHGRDGPGDRKRDGEWVALPQPYVAGPSPSLPSSLSLLSVLQAIEPAIVNAGHDPTQPDCPASLLSSLNELGERQLVSVVRWAKAIPGFRDLDVQDQMSVIQSSWLGVMVLGLGWRSYTHTDASMLYFAPDLVFNDHRMQVSSMYDHCANMRLLAQRFCALQVTQEEFLCMKALLLFSVIPVEGLRSQRCFDNMRRAYINELERLASQRGDAARMQRLFQLTQLLDFMQPIVRKLHQFTYDLFIQAKTLPIDVTFPDMIAEIVSMHVPKILTGMVQPILFHKTP